MRGLERDDWLAHAETHRARLAPFVEAHLDRRRRGVAHPVWDFLFTYYTHQPAQLLRWHPGYGVRLVNAPEYDGLKGYKDGAVTPEHLASQRPLLSALSRLLGATAARAAHTGCFGLHEWAMVYRQDDEQTRHSGWPLRLGTAGTDAVVEGHRIACSHFDAFRFFTEPARPLNSLSPGRDDRPEFEQPGCLHAGMDLYKHAFRLSPLISSDLVADAFELACDIRELDMRAAPYDFSGLDLGLGRGSWTPVPIETAPGKQTYAAEQTTFAERGSALRGRLLDMCQTLAVC